MRRSSDLELRQRLRAVGHWLTLGHPVFSYFLRILRQKLHAQAVVIAVDPLHHLFTLRYPITIAILCNGAIFCHVLSEARAPHHILQRPRGLGASGRSVPATTRSEEHTSELQSLMRISYAVLCLKKNTRTTKDNQTASRSPH